jgi:hypothetical protein
MSEISMAKCQLHLAYVELTNAPPRIICDSCWELIVDALDYYHEHHLVPCADPNIKEHI